MGTLGVGAQGGMTQWAEARTRLQVDCSTTVLPGLPPSRNLFLVSCGKYS